MISTSLKKKRKHHECTATKKSTKVVPNNTVQNSKTICTSLLWCWIKRKLLNILCAVTYNCKAILTLLTKSLQYSMAVHILNLRALEKTIQMISYKTNHITLQHLSLWEENPCAVDHWWSLRQIKTIKYSYHIMSANIKHQMGPLIIEEKMSIFTSAPNNRAIQHQKTDYHKRNIKNTVIYTEYLTRLTKSSHLDIK